MDLTDLTTSAPRSLIAAKAEALRGISRCRNKGWHVYGGSICLDSLEEAKQFREYADREWLIEWILGKERNLDD